MERIRRRLESFQESRRLPSQIELEVIVWDEPVGEFEPGVYIKTNIPYKAWRQNYRMIREEVATTLVMDEKLQQLIGGENTGIGVPLEKGLYAEPERGIFFACVAYHRKTGYAILKAERGPIGEAVRLMNTSQVRKTVSEFKEDRERQEK